jgi:Protein of unknown function (DUF3828)
MTAITSAASAKTPKATVESFYDAFIHFDPVHYGRPDYERVDRLLGAKLLKALKAQNRYQRVCAEVAPPNIKPYMIDQNPFFLWPDGVKKLITTRSVKSNRVVARLAYDSVEWEDTAILKQENGRWVIVEIVWEDGSTLTNRLAKFASHRCTP